MSAKYPTPIWLLVVFGAASAVQADSRHIIANEHRSKSPHVSTFKFDLPAVKAGQQVRLSLQARIDWPNLAGSNPWMIVDFNGQQMLAEHLLNKPVEFTMLEGSDVPWISSNRWRICYAPDFSDDIRTKRVPYSIPDADAYRAHRFLDYGGIFTPYPWDDEVEQGREPFCASFYPITPLQLRPGMVLGKERIVTNRSGRYGFADGNAAEVRVFDASGYRVDSPLSKLVDDDGRVLAEVRMPSDHMAVILAK